MVPRMLVKGITILPCQEDLWFDPLYVISFPAKQTWPAGNPLHSLGWSIFQPWQPECQPWINLEFEFALEGRLHRRPF